MSYTCYFGNDANHNYGRIWLSGGTITTRFAKNSSAYYPSDTSTGPSDGVNVKCDSDEYPTGITFGGSDAGKGLRNGATDHSVIAYPVYICDSDGNNGYAISTQRTLTEKEYYEASSMNQSGKSWTNLTGRTLALKKSGGEAWLCWAGRQTVTIATTYVARTITIASVTGGTVTASSTSRKRGETSTLTVTPSEGYFFAGFTATAGSITGSGTSYTFTMSTPAVNVTITPRFVCLNIGTSPLGTATASPSKGVVGAAITLTGTPNTGCTLLGWIARPETTFSGNNFTMSSSDTTVWPVFSRTPAEIVHSGRYNGSGWDKCVICYYNGSSWVESECKRFDGTNWINIESS